MRQKAVTPDRYEHRNFPILCFMFLSFLLFFCCGYATVAAKNPPQIITCIDIEEKKMPFLKAKAITNVLLERYADIVKVIIEGDGSMTPRIFPLENRIVIDIPDVVMKAPLPSVVSPLKDIRLRRYKDKIRLIFDLKEKTSFNATVERDSIVVTLKIEAPKVTKPPQEDKCKAYLEGRELISLDFQDQDILPIFRLLADISGCNLVVHPDVKGRYTAKLRNVPWNQALDTLLKTFHLGKSVEENVIRVAPLAVFTAEAEERARAAAAAIKAEPVETRIFPISYAKVADVEKAIRDSKILTAEIGNISIDERTSSLIVNDRAAVFPEIENLLAVIDKPTPQIMIEARIVEVSAAVEKDLGIQWGAFFTAADTRFSLSGFPLLGRGQLTDRNFVVDFPAGVGAGFGAGFSIGILNARRTMGLDLQLSALQEVGKGRIVSNPRILTVDGGKAYISQGESIPIRKLTPEGTVAEEFKDYVLSLTVTPLVAPDNSISLDIEVKKEEPDWGRISPLGTPASIKREANTKVIIKDGETVVIGGVFKTSRYEEERGVPFLMKIPLIGWLFKKKRIIDDTIEMLMFITPRVVHRPG